MDEEGVLRVHQSKLIMALARNEATILPFASGLEAKGVITETVKIRASNQYTDATTRASSIITSCISSVKVTPSKLGLIIEALRDVGLKELGDSLVMKVEDVNYPVDRSTTWSTIFGHESHDEFISPPADDDSLWIRYIIQKILSLELDKNEDPLRKAFDGLLQDIAQELNECDIVPHPVMRKPIITYDVIIKSFKDGLGLTKSVSELESYCSDFLQGLSNVGGLVKRAAIMLERKWVEAARKETGVVLQFKNKQYKPSLAGQTLAPVL